MGAVYCDHMMPAEPLPRRRRWATVGALVQASHPEPAVVVTAVAALLAYKLGQSGTGIATVALTVLASQLAVGWSNDLLDADRDATSQRPDKPVAAGRVGRPLVTWATALAAFATGALGFSFGVVPGLVAMVGLVTALAYNWPLKLGPLSVLPYAVSFAALPAFVVLATPGGPRPPGWLLAGGGLLGAGAHFANALPDLADDALTGVRGLPQRLGMRGSQLAAAALMVAAGVALAVGPPGPMSPAGIGISAVALLAIPAGWWGDRRDQRRGRRPTGSFRMVMVLAVVDTMLLLNAAIGTAH